MIYIESILHEFFCCLCIPIVSFMISGSDMFQSEFSPGEVVLAPHNNYLYWPGKIASNVISKALKLHENVLNPQDYCCVLFLGRKLIYSLVNKKYIIKFKTNTWKYNTEQHSLELSEALKMTRNADQLIDPPLELTPTRYAFKKEVIIKKHSN